MRRLFIASFFAASIGIFVFSASVFAAPYGSGSYGNCRYDTGCSQPAPGTTSNPPVPLTPEPAPVVQQVIIGTPGLDDNQVITTSPFSIVVTVTDGNGTPSTDVGWVAIYIDNKLVGTVYNPEADGSYEYVWDVREDRGKTISIVVYNKDGEIIARRDIPVRVALAPLPKPRDHDVINSTTEGPGLGAIGRFIHQTPPFIAKSFPYWLFVILLVLALRLIWQTVRETIGNDTMQLLLKKQRLIAEEKDNFIALSSHYLHTPLSVIRNGADTMLATSEASQAMMAPLVNATEKLKAQIDAILDQIENNGVLGSIKSPSEPQYVTSTLRSPYFWLPVVIVGAICAFANILFGLVGQIDLGVNNLFVQIILFAVLAVFFFVSFRTHRLREREHAKSKQLVDYQNAIDTARNNFISQSTNALSQGLEGVATAKASLPETPTKRYVEEGYSRFNDILAKFRLLSQLQASGATIQNVQTFPLKQALETAMVPFQEQITTKKLDVHLNTHNVNVTQNPQLFGYVLQTVIDNAIKFSNEGGEIAITASKASGRLQVSVIDSGIGIPADKLPSLFKPFSRAGSALQFDYEGLGFSLFLDRIIMDYLEGDIDAISDGSRGTTVTVTA